nr:uncharacterized protein LOC112762946 [Arachis hypogaea]
MVVLMMRIDSDVMMIGGYVIDVILRLRIICGEKCEFVMKKTSVYLIYGEPNNEEMENSHVRGDMDATDMIEDKNVITFRGFLISNWERLDRLCHPHGSNYPYCIKSAVNAEIDMVMVGLQFEPFIEDLTFLVKSGKVPISRIDDAVEQILRVKFAAGLFEFPFSDRSLLDMVGCKQHRDLAREAVRKSLVLLKDGKDISKPFLPLDRKAKRILVAGTHADDLGFQCGGWTKTWYGCSGRITIDFLIL